MHQALPPPPSPPPPWDGSHILAPYEIFPLPPPVVWWGCGTVPLFLFRPNTYIGTCMSIEHIYMRLQGSRKRYIE